MLWDRALQVLIAVSLVVLLTSLWNRNELPPASGLHAELWQPPVQSGTALAPFTRDVARVRYTIKPLFAYDLYGLVVSEHDSHVFWDSIHAAAHDELNVIDLCVVWGDDARLGSYRDVSFSSGEFTCYFEWKSTGDAAAFDIYQISNNHLLTEDARLAHILRSVHIGDEIHFHGYLAEYEHDAGFHFHRGTSTTRFDTGDGACETVYVTDAQILRSHGRTNRYLTAAAASVLVAAIIGWFARPAKVYD